MNRKWDISFPWVNIFEKIEALTWSAFSSFFESSSKQRQTFWIILSVLRVKLQNYCFFALLWNSGFGRTKCNKSSWYRTFFSSKIWTSCWLWPMIIYPSDILSSTLSPNSVFCLHSSNRWSCRWSGVWEGISCTPRSSGFRGLFTLTQSVSGYFPWINAGSAWLCFSIDFQFFASTSEYAFCFYSTCYDSL